MANQADDQRVYKDPFSEGLYNCTTGDNYLRGSEYHRLIAHLEKRATEIETLRAGLIDIASGAAMMLDSPPMAAVHRYAAEVKRVADETLGRKAGG